MGTGPSWILTPEGHRVRPRRGRSPPGSEGLRRRKSGRTYNGRETPGTITPGPYRPYGSSATRPRRGPGPPSPRWSVSGSGLHGPILTTTQPAPTFYQGDHSARKGRGPYWVSRDSSSGPYHDFRRRGNLRRVVGRDWGRQNRGTPTVGGYHIPPLTTPRTSRTDPSGTVLLSRAPPSAKKDFTGIERDWRWGWALTRRVVVSRPAPPLSTTPTTRRRDLRDL